LVSIGKIGGWLALANQFISFVLSYLSRQEFLRRLISMLYVKE